MPSKRYVKRNPKVFLVAVYLTENEYDYVRQKAKLNNISMSKLLSEAFFRSEGEGKNEHIK